ncbi:MAG: hypothetical protein ACJAS1_000859 [Oleiphilaceae bacterium]|jgi:hypothetical protein
MIKAITLESQDNASAKLSNFALSESKKPDHFLKLRPLEKRLYFTLLETRPDLVDTLSKEGKLKTVLDTAFEDLFIKNVMFRSEAGKIHKKKPTTKSEIKLYKLQIDGLVEPFIVKAVNNWTRRILSQHDFD